MAEITLTVQVSIPVSLTYDIKLPDIPQEAMIEGAGASKSSDRPA
jgi:hypothetical protein